IERVERDLGFRLRDLADAVGDEGAVAVMTSPGWRATTSPSFPGDLAIAVLQTIDAEDGTRPILRKVRRQTLGDDGKRFRIQDDKDERGLTAEPADPTIDPYAKVRLEGGTFFAAFGARG